MDMDPDHKPKNQVDLIYLAAQTPSTLKTVGVFSSQLHDRELLAILNRFKQNVQCV